MPHATVSQRVAVGDLVARQRAKYAEQAKPVAKSPVGEELAEDMARRVKLGGLRVARMQRITFTLLKDVRPSRCAGQMAFGLPVRYDHAVPFGVVLLVPRPEHSEISPLACFKCGKPL